GVANEILAGAGAGNGAGFIVGIGAGAADRGVTDSARHDDANAAGGSRRRQIAVLIQANAADRSAEFDWLIIILLLLGLASVEVTERHDFQPGLDGKFLGSVS